MSAMLTRMAMATLAVVGLGCGDNDSSSGSGVDGDKQLSELSTGESRKLCRFQERTAKDALGTEAEYCTAYALFAVQSVPGCKADRDACIASEMYEDELANDWECESVDAEYFVRAGDPCTATVAELEACFKEDAARWNELHQYTCEQAARVEYPVDDPLACRMLAEKCPNVEI